MKRTGRPPPIPWRDRHRPYRLGAITFLGLILAAKTFALGCGDSPAPGEEGGPCKDDGCHTYCENNAICDNSTNKCVASLPSGDGHVVPTPECNALGANSACPGAIAWSCSAGATPARTCILASEDDAGASVYCCAPRCTSGTASSACAAPGSSIYCDDPLSPEDTDAGLTCIDLGPASREHSYCCAPADTCFAIAREQVLPCPSGSEPYFCSGDAPPSDTSLRCTAAQNDAGSALHGYCCQTADGQSDGSVSDGDRD